jgi:hypothetical protein
MSVSNYLGKLLKLVGCNVYGIKPNFKLDVQAPIFLEEFNI